MKKFNVFAKILLCNIAKIASKCYFVERELLPEIIFAAFFHEFCILQPLTYLLKRRKENGS